MKTGTKFQYRKCYTTMNKLKYIIVLSLALFFSEKTFSQYNTMKELYVGIRGGTTYSTINLVPKYIDINYYPGYSGGFMFRYISEKYFGIEVDLNYTQSGWRESDDNYTGSSDYSYQRCITSYEMPVMLNSYFPVNKNFRFILNAGAHFAYLDNSDEDILFDNNYSQHGLVIENKFQYGLIGGLGMEVRFKGSSIGIEGRYSYFLSNIFKDAASNENFSNSNISTIYVSAYYQIQLTGKK